jgi:hypothetical protein
MIRIALAALLASVLLAGCAAPAPAPAAAEPTLDALQFLGSHNSYKRPIDGALLGALRRTVGPRMDALDYAHRPLAEQLDAGLRQLELDVFHDPEGGHYAAPRGLDLLRAQGVSPAPFDATALAAPGFKVLHVQDIDFRSHCPTLAACLAELARWSGARPDHLPVVVTVNAKQAPLEDPQATVPVPFDAAAWDALDAALIAGLGRERLIVPDAVRGDAVNLRAAVRTTGWPTLATARGRFLFVLDESPEVLAAYLAGHPSASGRVLFPAVPPFHPAAAFLVINDPVADGERIREAVAAGYLVRTRADADTVEARTGDTARREAAFASGAHYVSTDYRWPDPRFGTGYSVRLPGDGVVRCNPVSAGAGCVAPAAVPIEE